ncbi:hypothetical protein [Planctomicrobium sp. SH664]|uniref:hypothetical protein n=1 Tax=Planctomicrobium sp. SH664 TaxID=3448125 RepID=UPI003F5B9138
MFALRTRALTGLTLMATACGLTAKAEAQLFPGLDPCNTCAQPVMVQPIVQSACACAPCMRPITETHYEDVAHVEMVPVSKTVQVQQMQTVMEERDAVRYETITESRTVEVPSYTCQTVTECQAQTVNQSFWRTNYQPVTKLSPCAYDSRPGLLGEMNRLTYSMRNSLTPNYVARREFVPNVYTVNVPVQRVVQVPTTRQVTYSVPKVVAIPTKTQVAVARPIMVDRVVTVMEPRQTTKRVAVTRTRMAYVDPYGFGGTTSAVASEPTPATATNPPGKGTTRLQSVPSQETPIQFPSYRQSEPQPEAVEPTESGRPVAEQSGAAAIEFAGWSKSRRSLSDAEQAELSIVKK